MARPIKRLEAEADIVKELRRRSRSTTIGVRDHERAAIILLRLDGVGVEAVAEGLNTTPKRVSTWSRRFERLGLAGLDERQGRGRKSSIPADKVTPCHRSNPPAEGQGPLEYPIDEPSCRHLGEFGSAHLVEE